MPKDNKGVTPFFVMDDSALDKTEKDDALTDNALMLAVAQADQEAFSILMRRHMLPMVALARRITFNASDADEIVQEAFLRVWTHAEKWDANGPARFRTWLHRIVTNLSIDRIRKTKPLPLEAAGDPVDPLINIEADMERLNEAHIIQQALAQLPARQRAAIALCYFDNVAGSQAAEILGLSLGALESLLVRARRNLRSSLAHFKFFDGKEAS